MKRKHQIQPNERLQPSDDLKRQVAHCFEATAGDYAYWSKNLHMHFGVWRPWLNPLRLEAMLEEACQTVFAEFGRNRDERFDLLDAGCGVGSSLRLAAERFPHAVCYGITLVPCQVEEARRRLRSKRCQVVLDDFEATDFPDASFDVVFSIEAAVYGNGKDKAAYLTEVHRILRPGGVLVIMDGYLTKSATSMRPLTRWIYNQVCRGWAIADMIEKEPFLQTASRGGFSVERFHWLSLAIAPSVAHVPVTTLRYLWDSIVRKRRRSEDSIRHVVACICGCLLGMHLHRFAYGIAVLRKS